MHSFSMRPAKYFYDKPLTKYLDSKTVLIYRPHPVCVNGGGDEGVICAHHILKWHYVYIFSILFVYFSTSRNSQHSGPAFPILSDAAT